ncbi:MAG: DsrE family protein [Sulfuriferula sp.]
MKMKILPIRMAVICLLFSSHLYATESLSPWGSATEIQQEYSKQKVVYDITSGSLANLASVLDRASYLSQLNGADPFDTKIIIMLHGDAIPFFATANFDKHKDIISRAQSLSVADVVEFRLCKASASLQGFTAKDIHGFIKLVPMADAEIVRLQQEEGFAYMR